MIARFLMTWTLTRSGYVGRHRANTRMHSTSQGFTYVDETPGTARDADE